MSYEIFLLLYICRYVTKGNVSGIIEIIDIFGVM